MYVQKLLSVPYVQYDSVTKVLNTTKQVAFSCSEGVLSEIQVKSGVELFAGQRGIEVQLAFKISV